MNKVLAFLFALTLTQPALAGSGTMTTKDASGTTRTFVVVTDGSGNYVAPTVLCDYAAAANCAGINSAHSLQITGAGTAGTADSAGVVTVQGIAGMTKLLVTPDSVALPANQSVNMNQMGGTSINSGCVSNYGTAPGAVACPSSNVYVTNTIAALEWNSDANANTLTGSQTSSLIYGYNGSTIDRLRSTKGNLNVVNGGSTYQHVAASQTATVLQTSTGAAGDYLSHCVIYPSTTAAGSVTVFDNANAAATNVIEFSTGTLSNLAPIPIPVGAVSTAGAWKVTTGANETVVCYGKFS